MPLTPGEVEKVSLLGRLLLSPSELATMTTQLGQVVEYIQQLSRLDTSQVEPMAHAVELTNVFRDDVVRASREREIMLSNAPHADGQFYLVPAVLGD
jgi:aspartyl-tRNA(Asn)/glutamyl-tRNA(Gln) amidotransferase subunit C